ncbi:hypothetical protein [Nonomuraea africana]|uniref:Uncharacterized protein n=1 Tax=Nonomuraea africana TaxID=46171 RepID=A0ABR9KCF1_9ACTN|nr:hypothetical protein [Nonomuraea africana]MBE1559685.1 hypothetical protein [Nonomuraea africana]
MVTERGQEGIAKLRELTCGPAPVRAYPTAATSTSPATRCTTPPRFAPFRIGMTIVEPGGARKRIAHGENQTEPAASTDLPPGA